MHTHKDMLSRRFRMLTVSQLNFTPLESTGGQAQIIATINASSEALYISAAKLNITGATVFSSGNTLTEAINAGVTTIDGSSITAGSITANEITGNTLHVISANLGVITAGSLDAVTITASTITGSTLSTGSTNGNVYIIGDEIRLRWGTANKGEIYVDDSLLYFKSNYDVHVFLGTTGTGICSLVPNVDDTSFVGNASYAWDGVYSYDFHDLCSIYDNLDALDLLKSIKQKKNKDGTLKVDKYGHKKMDLLTLPEFLRRDPTQEDLNKYNTHLEKFNKLSDKAKEATLVKPSEPHTFRNLGRYVDLLAGCIKQLNEKVDALTNN